MPGTAGSQCSRGKGAHTARLPGSSASSSSNRWTGPPAAPKHGGGTTLPGGQIPQLSSPLTPHCPWGHAAHAALAVGTSSCRRTGRGTHRQIREGSFGSFRKPVALIRLDVVQYFHLFFLLATARPPGPVSRPFTESPKLLSAPLSVFLPSGQQEVSRGGAHSKPT